MLAARLALVWLAAAPSAARASHAYDVDQPLLAEIQLGDEATLQATSDAAIGTHPMPWPAVPQALAMPAVGSSLDATIDGAVNQGIIGTAIGKALKEAEGELGNVKHDPKTVSSIVKSVRESLEATAPKPVELLKEARGGEAGPVIGLAPAPSPQDVKYLEEQAAEARKYRKELQASVNKTAVSPDCEECRKYFRADKSTVSEAKKTEMEAKERLKEAEAWAALETKREDELPGLVKALQEEANLEHTKRVNAEKKASEANIARVAFEKREAARVATLRQAVARQRFVDRLRAAEDARVAACAVEAAKEARSKLKVKLLQGAAVEEPAQKPSGTLRLRVAASVKRAR